MDASDSQASPNASSPPADETLPLPSLPADATLPFEGPVSVLETRPEPVFEPGELIAGRYEVIRFLARGGMGEVYEVLDRSLGLRVALKTLLPSLSRDAIIVERFRREIQLARKVTHHNVCRLFDLGIHSSSKGSSLFLTMELLEGETLLERIQGRGPLPEAEALDLARQMASALAEAHKAGIVHRDFKSANVILSREAGGVRVVVTDFGLARSHADDSSLTLVGEGLIGTPAYMAPEQVRGGEALPASDVYAFGIVFYEMLTGRRPFQGVNPLATAMLRLQGPAPSPRLLAPDLSQACAELILHCLEMEPDARPRNAIELVGSLVGGKPLPSSRRKRWTRPRVACLLFCAFGMAAGAWLWFGESPPRAGASQIEAGRRHLWAHDAAAALSSFQEALALDPGNLSLQADLAEALFEQGRETRASETLLQALEWSGRPSQKEGLRLSLLQARLQGKAETIQELCETLVDVAPEDPDVLLMASEAYLAVRDIPQASRTLRRLQAVASPAMRSGIRMDLLEAGIARMARDSETLQRALLAAAGKATDGSSPLELARLRMLEAFASAGKAEGLLREAHELCQGRGDRLCQAQALLAMAQQRLTEATPESALPLFEECQKLLRGLGNRSLLALGLASHASLLWQLNRTAEALPLLREALQLDQRRGNSANESQTRILLSAMLQEQGQFDEARDQLEEARRLAKNLGDALGESTALGNLATVLLLQGDLRTARSRMDEAFEIQSRSAPPAQRANALLYKASFRLLEGDLLAYHTQFAEVARQLRAEDLPEPRLLFHSLDRTICEERSAAMLERVSLPEQDIDEALEPRLFFARCAANEGRFEEARRQLAFISEASRKRLRSVVDRKNLELLEALIEAAIAGKADGPIESATAILNDAIRMGCYLLEMESRLVLGEIKLRSGQKMAGLADLEALEGQARARGFGQMARRAAAARRGQ